MSPEELEQERKESMERRRKQLEILRREKPIVDPTPARGLSRAQKKKLKDDEFVPPED